jgi:membrane protease YdiL (CAAX protease family)
LPSVDGIFLIKLLKAFLIGVFGIALWEELVSQGYIQTRLQEVWGFFGAILSALMFASLHLPSALLEFRFGPGMIVLYFLKILLSGFMLAYIYWKTKSTLATIMIHGFRNFTFVVAFSYSGLNPRALHMLRPELQILWSVGEVLLAVLLLGQDLPNKDELGEMFRMIIKKTGDHFSF